MVMIMHVSIVKPVDLGRYINFKLWNEIPFFRIGEVLCLSLFKYFLIPNLQRHDPWPLLNDNTGNT